MRQQYVVYTTTKIVGAMVTTEHYWPARKMNRLVMGQWVKKVTGDDRISYLQYASTESPDCIQFCQANKLIYPTCFSMLRVIPATSVAIERAFSAAGLICSGPRARNRLVRRTVSDLGCIVLCISDVSVMQQYNNLLQWHNKTKFCHVCKTVSK